MTQGYSSIGSGRVTLSQSPPSQVRISLFGILTRSDCEDQGTLRLNNCDVTDRGAGPWLAKTGKL